MESNNINAPEIESSLRGLLADASKLQTEVLKQFAQAQTDLAASFAEAQKRLTESLGADNPRVQALSAAADAAGQLKTALSTAAERQSKLRPLEENERMVHGRVLDANGAPVAGLKVRVSDKDRKYDDLLGVTTTDEFGDFAVVFHDRDFAETRENKPELYVTVEDARGRQLFSSRDKVELETGRVDHFEIALAPAATRRPAARRAATPRQAPDTKTS